MGKELALFTALGLFALAGCGDGHDHSAHDHGSGAAKAPETPAAPLDPNAKPYPLKTCAVSGEELGKMGEPMRFTYKGQEIKLCCKNCKKDFDKEPEKYLRVIADGGRK